MVTFLVCVVAVLWLGGIYLMDALLSHDPEPKSEADKALAATLRILWPITIVALVVWLLLCRLVDVIGDDDNDTGAPR